MTQPNRTLDRCNQRKDKETSCGREVSYISTFLFRIFNLGMIRQIVDSISTKQLNGFIKASKLETKKRMENFIK